MDEAHALAKRSSTRDGRYQTRDVKKGSESLGSWIGSFLQLSHFPTMKLCVVWLYLISLVLKRAEALSPSFSACRSTLRSNGAMYMSLAEIQVQTLETTKDGLQKRDRYVATNRFAVRKGQNAKFEKRWATRKSRLSTLPGFKYFHLMRRVTLNEDGTCTYDEGDNDETAQENYVSFTIWNKKSDFSAWRSGEAFKEAHGGTSIGAFLSTMVNSAMVLRGAPRPAFYDGLHLQAVKPDVIPETVDGWRNVEHDGINMLPAECFVEMIKYFVPPGPDASAFEQAWTNRDSSLKDASGFVGSSLLRRDGQAKGYVLILPCRSWCCCARYELTALDVDHSLSHGIVPVASTEPSYVAATIFASRASFEAAGRTSLPVITLPDQSQSPESVFYEGTLVISSGTS
jgi:heme-degrading monooxygenase HmoA